MYNFHVSLFIRERAVNTHVKLIILENCASLITRTERIIWQHAFLSNASETTGAYDSVPSQVDEDCEKNIIIIQLYAISVS